MIGNFLVFNGITITPVGAVTLRKCLDHILVGGAVG